MSNQGSQPGQGHGNDQSPPSSPESPPPTLTEETMVRAMWLAVCAVASVKLALANAVREHLNDWPGGQVMADMSGSSRAVFMQQAREHLGIEHDWFLEAIGSVDLDADYQNPPALDKDIAYIVTEIPLCLRLLMH